jgi:hypothetical protein
MLSCVVAFWLLVYLVIAGRVGTNPGNYAASLRLKFETKKVLELPYPAQCLGWKSQQASQLRVAITLRRTCLEK